MKTCPCGNQFKPKTKRHKYCKWECWYEYYSKPYARNYNKNVYRPRIRTYPQPATCIICKKQFNKLKPSHLTCGTIECKNARRRQYYRDVSNGIREVKKNNRQVGRSII